MKVKVFITATLILTWFSNAAMAFAAPNLSISPATGTFNRGCSFSLNVDFNTAGQNTAGIDAILGYDASIFTATSIQNGTVYTNYPGNVIDTQNGKISIAGTISVDQSVSNAGGVNGQGTLATVNFTVKNDAPLRTTQINFDFDPNDKAKTTDSNIAEKSSTNNDILDSVTNGNYTIGSGSCSGATPTPTPRPRVGGPTGSSTDSAVLATATPRPRILTQTGDPRTTFVLTVVGSAIVIAGILGLALL
jgi:hypothetical protein